MPDDELPLVKSNHPGDGEGCGIIILLFAIFFVLAMIMLLGRR